MGKGFRAVWAGLVDAYGELFPVVGMNLLWLLFSTPLGFLLLVLTITLTGAAAPDDETRSGLSTLFGIFVVVVLVLGPNPAAAGIHHWANRLVKEERVEFALFWEGLRTYWWPATKLFLITVVGFFLLFTNALFYLRSEVAILQVFGVIWLYAIYFWTSMQIYQLPLLIEQEDKRLRLVLRNSFFLALSNFVPTLTVVVICTILTVLSLGLTLLIAMITGSLVVLIANRVTMAVLERYRPSAVGDGSAA